MTNPSTPQMHTARRSGLPVLGPKGLVVLLLLVVGYLLLRPWLESKLGIELPGVFEEQRVAGGPQRDSEEEASAATDATVADTSTNTNEARVPQRQPDAAADGEPASSSTTDVEPGDDQIDAVNPSASTTAGNSTNDEPALGQLTEIGRGSLRSTAGLVYRSLRSEHRIDHVLRHAEDDPDRPVHGVFDGDRAEILAVIDEAWQMAQQRGPPAVQTEQQDDRTVYIIDLGRRIGYVGGQSGQRRRHPACRHLQLVVEGDEVVTAYPTTP
jgi:hypothetical protein